MLQHLRRSTAVFLVAIIALVAFAPKGNGSDEVGIHEIYPSAPDGMHWEANWTGGEYAWSEDPWVEIGSRDVRYRTADGVLSISGNLSRLYIREPNKQRQWRDVEVTIYAKRIADEDIDYSGIVSAVRINHGVTAPLADAPCDSRGLSARLRFDGAIDFGKEIAHPNTVASHSIEVFPNGLPYGEWIGYKHIVYDIDNGTGTRQELWMDLTDGRDGGAWNLFAVHEDHSYSGIGEGETPCAPGIDPAIPYVNGPRAGSESGLPSIAVLIRADGIGFNGLQYKWTSVREITAG